MRKARKIIGIVLSLAMIAGFVWPQTSFAAVEEILVNDGSSELTIANNDNEAKVDCEYGISSVGGKSESDVCNRFEVKNGATLTYGGGCYLPNKWFGNGVLGKRMLIAFDILFASADARLHFEAQTYDEANQSSSRNSFIMIGPEAGITRYTENAGLTYIPEEVPASLSCNKWHNVAVELVCDGSNAVNIYIDGVRYECEADVDIYGIFRFRLNLVKGSMYIDNYRCVAGEQEDDVYAEEDYQLSYISVAENEKVRFDETTGEFKILDETLTVAELKEAITVEEGYTKEVYQTAECESIVSDESIANAVNCVVISNGNGAFRYYAFEHINNSEFEIEPMYDGVGCRVLGYKEGATYDTTKITIPEYIAGYVVKEIGASAFDSVNVSKGDLTLPDTVEVIGNKAFYDSYCSVRAWPANLKSIGASAFVHDVIYAAAFPDGFEKISSSAFTYANVQAIPVFPDSFESIGNNAYEWSGLKALILPDSVKTVGREIVRTCMASLHTVRFPKNSTVTSIPSLMFTSKDTKTDGYLFKDMNIYIPENITTIPSDLLVNFKDGASVTIYGAYDSAAYTFYEEVKAALEAGTYVNNAVYGEEGAYTDSDGDGKGELAQVNFIEYNFEYDCANVINETNINKGDEDITLNTPTNNPVLNIGAKGVGGKAEDDVVIELISTGGGGGYNYLNSFGNEPKFVREISICVPETGKINANFGYFTDSTKKAYNIATAWEISTNGVYVFDNKAVDVKAGEWINMAIVIDNNGTDKVTTYVNGTPYKEALEAASYGVRHFRDYQVTSSKAYTVYYDNLRSYCEGDITYNPMADAPAKVSAASDEIKITDKGIVFVSDDAQYTVSELIDMLEVNEGADAALRVYTDRSFSAQLSDDDVIGKDAVLVVAAKNGYSFERTYSYYAVNPEVNRTIYDFAVISEADKTAAVTGFLEENITKFDDLTAIKIPESIMGYTITEIAANAFKEDPVVQSVVIPDTVTKIGAFAFAGTSSSGKTTGVIKEVKMSENIKTIERYAFACNANLAEIELPDGLEKIEANAFYWTGLKEISIPDTVTSLGNSAFRLCSELRYVKLSSGVTSITGDVFYGGSVNITDFVIPETVTNIAESVFMGYDMDTTVYGVAGSYAEQWANKYGFEFVDVIANTMVAAPKILGDGEKEIFGTDFELSYGFETLTFDGKLINIGVDDIEALVGIAMYDESGLMVEYDSEKVTVLAGKSIDLDSDYDVTIPAAKLKDGYTVKGFVWRASNIEPIADEKTVVFNKENKEVHVLLMGNSFGNDSFAYLNDIAEADGVILKTQNMYIGSQPLKGHYTNIVENLAKYQPVIDGVYGANLITMKEGLESDKWDVVALQCGTHGFSNDLDFLDYDKEDSTAAQMYAYIKEYVETYAPTARKAMHMSWGPCDEQSRDMYDGRFSDETLYPDASRAVFEAQKRAYEYATTIFSDEAGMMIPSSYAIWYAIDELGYSEHSGEKSSDNKYPNPVEGEVSMFRDETCHLTSGTSPYGRVLAGLCWYEYLTGNDARENPYQNPGISEEAMAGLKEAAHWANTQVVPVNGSAAQ